MNFKFGYTMINGKIEIDERQASIFRKAVDDYIAGRSLKHKAEHLTDAKVEYAEGKSNWNKNRVQRMLTDRTYLGTESYPPIIDTETFETVQQIMQSRNTQKGCRRQEVFSPTVVPILCGACGQPTIRRYNGRLQKSTKHTCTNPDCKSSYAILDNDLWEMVKAAMTGVSERQDDTPQETRLDIVRLNNEIERELQRLDIDGEMLQNKIFECAALQYAALQSQKQESMDFTDVSPCSPFFIREVKRMVRAVVLISDQKIRLQMADGHIAGEDGEEDDISVTE